MSNSSIFPPAKIFPYAVYITILDKTIKVVIHSPALDLIRRLLTRDPQERISMDDAMNHPWLQDDKMKEKVEQLIEEEKKKMPRDMPPPLVPVSHPTVQCDDSYGFL